MKKLVAGIATAGLITGAVVVNEVVDKPEASSAEVVALESGAPAYTNGQYYVWEANQGATATNALNYINTSGFLPIIGENAKTGEKEPDKHGLSKWNYPVRQRNDGKFCFMRLDESLLDYAGVPATNRVQFFTVFGPSVEMYQDDWFNQEE